MKNKIVFWMRPFFRYSIVVFILMLILKLSPPNSDPRWLIGWVFYVPYLCLGIHILGFRFGYSVQQRSKAQTVQIQLQLCLIAFIITLLINTMVALGYEFDQFIIYSFLPSLVSSLLFFIGEIIAKRTQIGSN